MAKKNGLSKKIAANIPFIMDQLGRKDIPKNNIMSKYFDLEGVQGEEAFGGEKDKYGRLPFGMLFASTLTKLKKNGTISSPKRSVYTLVDDSSIPTEFLSALSGNVVSTPAPAPVVEEPVEEAAPVEATPIVEESSNDPGIEITDTVDVTPLETAQVETIPVEVANPAVIEAHIDTTTNELVENVGGSKDYRKSLDNVDDGYITSNVVETTSTIETPVVESVESSNVVETTSTIEIDEDLLSDLDGLVDEQPTGYDVKQLLKDNAFDPVEFSYTTKTGQTKELSYLFYPDFENLKLVMAQPNREDYVIVNMDCGNIQHNNEKMKKIANVIAKEFRAGTNAINATEMFVRCIASCAKHCHHDDEFYGFVEACLNPTCPITTIFYKDAIHVQPDS
tara:strand:- start:1463 stop:2641 length:1179 start_codon:yes stop_codon:yes gene_type:complete